MQSPPPIPPGGDPTAAIITAIFTGVAAVLGTVTTMVVAFRSWRDKERGTGTPEPGTVVLRSEEYERLLLRGKDDGAADHEA